MTHTLAQFLATIEPDSFLYGTGAGFLLTALLFFILYDRLQRKRLILDMHRSQANTTIARLEQEYHLIQVEHRQALANNQELGKDIVALETTNLALREQLLERERFQESTRKELENEFQVLASHIFTEKSGQINQQHQSSLKLLLGPFHEQLMEFRKKVDHIYDLESRDRVAMLKEIEHLKSLNQQVSTDALNLTQALQGKSKTQGLWGEMLLEKLLEDSGLREGSEFQTQVSFKTEDGNLLQPDVIVHLPGQRDIIIDAKVSLKAFMAVQGEEDSKVKARNVQQHLDSVNKHISSLSRKKYHHLTGLGSLDFVLLFIPVEGAFQMVVAENPDILTKAMRMKIILASPSTLLAILKTIHHIWRMDEQNRNGLLIAKQAGSLYDKFINFLEAFEEIGLRLSQTQQAWDLARKRLTTGQGNLISKTESLKDLGIQPSKDLPDSLKQNH